MRYCEIYLTKHRDDKHWTVIYINPEKISYTMSGLKTFDVDGLTLVMKSENSISAFIPEEHPLFNYNVIRNKYHSDSFFEPVKWEIESYLIKLIDNLKL